MIEERKFIIYHKILYIIDNCRIVDEDSLGTAIETDLLQHRKLLDDLASSFFTRKISTRKIGHAYFVGNPFLTIKIYNGFN